MKNISLIIIILASLGLGACTLNPSGDTSQPLVETQPESVPTRAADINGNVRSIEGNEVIVANELKVPLSEEEQAAQKAERQAMTQEERQALRQQELETVETESVTITIPVGSPIFKASGTGDSAVVPGELSDIKVGTYLSMWVENNQVIAVKIKGTNE